MDNLTKLSLSINLDKVNMEWVYTGAKGRYLNFTIYIRDHVDQYGNSGFVSQSASKEAYQAGQRGEICGNIKGTNPPPNAVGHKPKTTQDDEEDVPF